MSPKLHIHLYTCLLHIWPWVPPTHWFNVSTTPNLCQQTCCWSDPSKVQTGSQSVLCSGTSLGTLMTSIPLNSLVWNSKSSPLGEGGAESPRPESRKILLQHLISPSTLNPLKRDDQRKRFKILSERARSASRTRGVGSLNLPRPLSRRKPPNLLLRSQVFEEASPGDLKRLRDGQGHKLDDRKRLLELKF